VVNLGVVYPGIGSLNPQADSFLNDADFTANILIRIILGGQEWTDITPCRVMDRDHNP
jgi:hypothetical protein